MTRVLDDFVRNQLIAMATLAINAIAAGLRDTVMIYTPGDAPVVTRYEIQSNWQLSTDGLGTFDVWQLNPLNPVKSNLTRWMKQFRS